ncbi:uncharacterized protein HKW66_Vig0193600 [Vigna angularis]|uniref:Uncharacterized protein n=1 Tax=Phaseolus angularis TaxID=3914 RepID=A0A8T0KPI0_PHAAN|nr:uncharacterized protein HKW66_Vig0193600 [Vigna angularis]
MSQENGTATFSTTSPLDVHVRDPNKRLKISYTREFLLSLDQTDLTVKFPSVLDDEASELFSLRLCVPDPRCQKSVPQNFSLEVPRDINSLLHRSDEPYRPPCRYKSLPSTRHSNDLLNGDISGSCECANQEIADREIWRKGRISICRPSEACISPTSVGKEKQFASMVDDCESSTVYCRGISVGMKQNPSSPDFHVRRELKLNSFTDSIDGESSSSSELCLPDEDSLITFDELFLLSDVENLAVVDSSMSSTAERSPIEAEVFSPSSPREMIEKLVEFILNEESSTPNVDDPMVHHGTGLGCFSHSTHAQQNHAEFCSNHLNPERKDQLDHNRFQINSIDSVVHSFFSHSFPSNPFSQHFPLYHDELERFDHGVSQTMFQQIINPDKLHVRSLSVSKSGVPLHLPALQMASCTQKLNSMPTGTFAYQEPKNYGDFVKSSLDFQGHCNINPTPVDSCIEMKLRANHCHPHMQGF